MPMQQFTDENTKALMQGVRAYVANGKKFGRINWNEARLASGLTEFTPKSLCQKYINEKRKEARQNSMLPDVIRRRIVCSRTTKPKVVKKADSSIAAGRVLERPKEQDKNVTPSTSVSACGFVLGGVTKLGTNRRKPSMLLKPAATTRLVGYDAELLKYVAKVSNAGLSDDCVVSLLGNLINYQITKVELKHRLPVICQQLPKSWVEAAHHQDINDTEADRAKRIEADVKTLEEVIAQREKEKDPGWQRMHSLTLDQKIEILEQVCAQRDLEKRRKASLLLIDGPHNVQDNTLVDEKRSGK